MILLMGDPSDAQAAAVIQALNKRGVPVTAYDSLRFPEPLRAAYSPTNLSDATLIDTERGIRIALADVQAVYWRRHGGYRQGPPQDPYLQQIVFRENRGALGSLYRMLPCRWVNAPDAMEMHWYKPYQLHLLHQAGIRVPDTLIANDPEAVRAFFERHEGSIIYKPVLGGGHASRLTAADFSDEKLASLAQSPVSFQELVPGTNIRVYALPQALFALEIASETLDFRDDPNADLRPLTLPPDVQAACRTACRVLGLTFSGIDLRRTPEGEYVMLEANPSPMFVTAERATGYPITQALVDCLLSPSP